MIKIKKKLQSKKYLPIFNFLGLASMRQSIGLCVLLTNEHDRLKSELRAVQTMHNKLYVCLSSSSKKVCIIVPNKIHTPQSHKGFSLFKLPTLQTDRWARRKLSGSYNRPETEHKCNLCNRDCHSCISLYSHRCRCSSQTD